MYRKIASVAAAGAVIAAYLIFLDQYEKPAEDQTPEIEFDEDTLILSVTDDWERLMDGVYCYDAEDGDLTDKILIDSLSEFNSSGERTVRYVAFDSMNQPAVAERALKYTDYTPPEIWLTDSLTLNNISQSSISKIVAAQSCVDGDITRELDVKVGTLDNNRIPVEVSVSDSTGTLSELSFSCDYDTLIYQAEILLNQYLMTVPAGQEPDLYGNVKDIQIGRQSNMQMMEWLTVQSAVDAYTPGIYEVYYYLNTENGVNGRCKGLVRVQ